MNLRFLWTPLILFSCASGFALDGTLLVANRSGGSISFFDLRAEVEIARVPVGPIIPHEVAVSPDGRLALTAEYGPNSNPGRRVTLIDVATASILGSIDLGPDSRPHSPRFLPDGDHAVVTLQDSDRLALLDLTGMRVVRTYPTGGREGHMVRLSPDGSRAYVTSRGAEGTLSVIFLNEERPPVVIETGPGAEGLAVTPDGGEVWVANRAVESISIVDTRALEVVATLESRPSAGRIEMDPDGRAIVPNGGGGGSPVPQYLRVYDIRSREMVTEVPLRDGQPQDGNFGVLAHDGLVFVSDPGAGTIQIFDLNAMSERRVLVTHQDAPDGMAWTPVRVRAMTDAPERALPARDVPRFEVDPAWPRPLPDGWINGQIGGVCVDAHDHVVIVDRRNITDEELETSVATPPILMFDTTGALMASWGDPEVVPNSIHGCAFDAENDVWVAGNEDGIIQKYSHEGELLKQIGIRGVFDTSDGTADGPALNSGSDRFFRPSAVAIHPDTADIYVADGYGNRRVAVFDPAGNFLRQWGRQATEEEVKAGTPGAFAQVVHCVAISRDGLVYVCDRQADRIQVFDGNGAYVRSIRIPADEPNARGTAWWVAFSPDAEQRYLYVMNGGQERVHIVDRESGETLSTFGRPGHQIGNFTHGHTLAVDSTGNLYVAETNWGRRVQRFKLVRGR